MRARCCRIACRFRAAQRADAVLVRQHLDTCLLTPPPRVLCTFRVQSQETKWREDSLDVQQQQRAEGARGGPQAKNVENAMQAVKRGLLTVGVTSFILAWKFCLSSSRLIASCAPAAGAPPTSGPSSSAEASAL